MTREELIDKQIEMKGWTSVYAGAIASGLPPDSARDRADTWRAHYRNTFGYPRLYGGPR